jgi:hypothetical protein
VLEKSLPSPTLEFLLCVHRDDGAAGVRASALVIADRQELEIEFAARRHAISGGHNEKANPPVTRHMQPAAVLESNLGFKRELLSQLFLTNGNLTAFEA